MFILSGLHDNFATTVFVFSTNFFCCITQEIVQLLDFMPKKFALSQLTNISSTKRLVTDWLWNVVNVDWLGLPQLGTGCWLTFCKWRNFNRRRIVLRYVGQIKFIWKLDNKWFYKIYAHKNYWKLRIYFDVYAKNEITGEGKQHNIQIKIC